MEMWELLKSLFSEVNFSFWNASVVQTPQYSRAEMDRAASKVGPWSSDGQRAAALPWADLWKQRSGSPAEQDELRRRVCYRVTLQKSHILGEWILSDQCAMIFVVFCCCCFFLRGWGTLQLVVMRPTECGERGRESWEPFTCCGLLLWHLNRHTNTRTMQKWLGEDSAAVLAWFTRNVFIALFKRLRLLSEEMRWNSSLFREYIIAVVGFFCF